MYDDPWLVQAGVFAPTCLPQAATGPRRSTAAADRKAIMRRLALLMVHDLDDALFNARQAGVAMPMVRRVASRR